MIPALPPNSPLTPEEQRELAVALFNHTWTLLGTTARSEREDDLMIDAAHASRLLWETVGEAVNHARGEWQISRVYAVLGRGEPALHHARRCLEICEKNDIVDFDLAFANEALARAHAAAGDPDAAARFTEAARSLAEQIADADDRDAVWADLETLPR